ncbi:MAG TPA: DUF6364 family protein [Spirochaetales bacterium]|nr:DUF6364 family protein [Spirochaetales bacterium]
METKLTLRIDKSVIERAKEYARQRKKSLSDLVEDYFRHIVSSDGDQEPPFSPLVEELSGIISEQDLKGLNYVDYLEEKYE